MAATTSRVTISRTSPTDVGQRQVVVRLDDGERTNLMFGDTISRDLRPGDHVLHAHNTLVWKRVRFTTAPDEHIEFVVVNRPGRFTLGFLSLMGVAPLFLSIERRPGRDGAADLQVGRP
jgi:hypothetical protein